MTEAGSKRSRVLAAALTIALLVISLAGSVYLVLDWKNIAQIQRQGYSGLFIISIFAGSPLPIPTPSMILTFTLGSVLNPFIVGVVSGFGNGIGNALIFWTGRGGLAFFRNLSVPRPTGEHSRSRIGRFFRRLSRVPDFARRRVLLAVFLLSIYPNPILTPVILGLGATRSSFWKFFFVIWAGKTTQCLILSFLGYLGLRSLLRFFGVFQLP
jgi:membrane protein YqaA with SNARE-associated domain